MKRLATMVAVTMLGVGLITASSAQNVSWDGNSIPVNSAESLSQIVKKMIAASKETVRGVAVPHAEKTKEINENEPGTIVLVVKDGEIFAVSEGCSQRVETMAVQGNRLVLKRSGMRVCL